MVIRPLPRKRQYLLVEPIAKTPYPPLGLMKISSMLRGSDPECEIYAQVGAEIPEGLIYPERIYVTSLFTWDLDKVIKVTNVLRGRFPSAEIMIGGIAASLLPEVIQNATGIKPHVGLLNDAEFWPPDYSLSFGRKNKSSISFTSRGCVRKCKFCTVNTLEPQFFTKNDWEKDICSELPEITFWDNNWLASPNFDCDVEKLKTIGKKVDFNQGIDARLYTRQIAEKLSGINMGTIRFAFDNIADEQKIISAIRLAKQFISKEISVYVLYNFNDSPEEFYYKVKLLNEEQVLAFPMCYREPNNEKRVFPNGSWNTYLLRGLKLSLMFYYRKGMITLSKNSFSSIYGDSPAEFAQRLYAIYEYDKQIKRQ